MSKIIKYSKINSKFNGFINTKKIDTILLDKCRFDYKDIKNDLYEKNIIIKSNLLGDNIGILGTSASNIYFEGYDNLGGITIPFELIGQILIRFNNDSKLKKINILGDKVITLDLEDYIKSVKIFNTSKLIFDIDYNNRNIVYEVYEDGNIKEIKKEYTINEEDIVDNTLNLCNLIEYNKLKYKSLSCDTLVINKCCLENINKISNFGAKMIYRPFHERVKFNKLKLIDDNEMKLNPINITFDYANYCNTTFLQVDNSICIDKKNNDTVIFLDKNGSIKIYNEKEIKEDKKVKEVYFQKSVQHGFLIVIKYKDYYKVIVKDNEYIVPLLFFILLSNNYKKYHTSSVFKETLEKYDLIELFRNYINKKDFIKMYNDYIEYKNYIEKLKELGFSNASIKYLFDKKIESIIIPSKENINNISDIEVKCFNEIGNDYVNKKRLKRE